MPYRRRVSMCTKMSGVPSPRVRKPKPRSRLNHLTCARSSPLVGVTVTWVRAGGICAGWIAVDSSIETMRKACSPLGRCSTSHDDPRTFIGGLVAVAAQARHVQKNVGHAVVGNDESKTLGDIEPLDDTGQLDESVAVSSTSLSTAAGRRLVPDIFDSIPSDAMTPNAAPCWRLLMGASANLCGIEDNTDLRTAKGQNRLAHSSVHSVASDESVRDERRARRRCHCARRDRQFRRNRSARD